MCSISNLTEIFDHSSTLWTNNIEVCKACLDIGHNFIIHGEKRGRGREKMVIALAIMTKTTLQTRSNVILSSKLKVVFFIYHIIINIAHYYRSSCHRIMSSLKLCIFDTSKLLLCCIHAYAVVHFNIILHCDAYWEGLGHLFVFHERNAGGVELSKGKWIGSANRARNWQLKMLHIKYQY